MTQTIQKKLNDYAWARWGAMVLIALMMLFAHMFVDAISPLQEIIQKTHGWTPDVFGTFMGSEYLLNVLGFLIVAGIILDKMGIRFTGLTSAIIMVVGACIKYFAVSDAFIGTGIEAWLNSWWVAMPASAKLASFGFMIFGCGCEMAGITASKALAKWFEGKEMALAMGLEMALARVGVFFIFTISPRIAGIGGADPSVVRPVAFCTALLLIGLICYTIFCLMDKKLDKQLGEVATGEPEEEFKIGDIGKIFSSRLFWIVAMLCVLYYSAIFPFQKFAANMLQLLCVQPLVPCGSALVQRGFDTREQFSVYGVAVVVLHKCPPASSDTRLETLVFLRTCFRAGAYSVDGHSCCHNVAF